jgi:hypothetical protein
MHLPPSTTSNRPAGFSFFIFACPQMEALLALQNSKDTLKHWEKDTKPRFWHEIGPFQLSCPK